MSVGANTSVTYVDAKGFRRNGTHVCASCVLVATTGGIAHSIDLIFSFVRHPCSPIHFGRLLMSPGRVGRGFDHLVGRRVGGGRTKGPTCVLVGVGRVASPMVIGGLCRTSSRNIQVSLLIHNGYSLVAKIPKIDSAVHVGNVVSHCLRRSHVFVFTGNNSRGVFVNSTS